ncbi:MAG: RHS repeat-associated core domain-containing protein [Planctomycetia bacterium]
MAEYKYDALGRRVEKSVTGATYRYIYSGVETVSVYTSAGTWKQDYVYGPGIDEVLMLEQADVLDWDGDSNTSELARSWYRANALGSVMRIEEPDRTEAVSYRYDPYGEVSITRGGSAQGSDPLGQYVTYTGRWRDEETGLYHYRARAYDPVRGRFLQRDPLGYSDGPSLFEYCHSSPIDYVDPDGMDDKKALPPPVVRRSSSPEERLKQALADAAAKKSIEDRIREEEAKQKKEDTDTPEERAVQGLLKDAGEKLGERVLEEAKKAVEARLRKRIDLGELKRLLGKVGAVGAVAVGGVLAGGGKLPEILPSIPVVKDNIPVPGTAGGADVEVKINPEGGGVDLEGRVKCKIFSSDDFELWLEGRGRIHVDPGLEFGRPEGSIAIGGGWRF